MCRIYTCNTCVLGVLHMYHKCMNYMCNIPKTPHIYYMCIAHVAHLVYSLSLITNFTAESLNITDFTTESLNNTDFTPESLNITDFTTESPWNTFLAAESLIYN